MTPSHIQSSASRTRYDSESRHYNILNIQDQSDGVFDPRWFAQQAYGSSVYRAFNGLLRKFGGSVDAIADRESRFTNAEMADWARFTVNNASSVNKPFFMPGNRMYLGSGPGGLIMPSQMIRDLDNSMLEIKAPVRLDRIFGSNTFGSDPMSALGSEFSDHGWFSTQAPKKSGADYYKNGLFNNNGVANPKDMIRSRIYTPAGAGGIVGNQDESEIVLGRGGIFQVAAIKPSKSKNFGWDAELIMTGHEGVQAAGAGVVASRVGASDYVSNITSGNDFMSPTKANIAARSAQWAADVKWMQENYTDPTYLQWLTAAPLRRSWGIPEYTMDEAGLPVGFVRTADVETSFWKSILGLG